MIRLTSFGAAVISVMSAAGCAELPNPPLIFGQTHTVGITIAGSPAEQGGEFTLGYRDRDLAFVPVTVTQGDGAVTQRARRPSADEAAVSGPMRSGDYRRAIMC